MDDRLEHLGRTSVATALVEVAQLDLCYEGCRLKSSAAEARLLSAIAAGGIQEPLQEVEVPAATDQLPDACRSRSAA